MIHNFNTALGAATCWINVTSLIAATDIREQVGSHAPVLNPNEIHKQVPR